MSSGRNARFVIFLRMLWQCDKQIPAISPAQTPQPLPPLSTQFLHAVGCTTMEDVDRFFPPVRKCACKHCGTIGPCRTLCDAALPPEGNADKSKDNLLERIAKYRATGKKNYYCPVCFATVWNGYLALLDNDVPQHEKYEQDFWERSQEIRQQKVIA